MSVEIENMTPEQQAALKKQLDAAANPGKDEPEEIESFSADAKKYIEKLRKENAKHRTANKALAGEQETMQQQLAKLQAEQSKIEAKAKEEARAKLVVEGKTQELLEQYQQEATALEAKLAEAESKAEQWANYQSTQKAKLLEKLPQEKREFYNSQPLDVVQDVIELISAVQPAPAASQHSGVQGQAPAPQQAPQQQGNARGMPADEVLQAIEQATAVNVF